MTTLTSTFMITFTHSNNIDPSRTNFRVIKFIDASSTSHASEWAKTYIAYEKTIPVGQPGYQEFECVGYGVHCVDTSRHKIGNIDSDMERMKLQTEKNLQLKDPNVLYELRLEIAAIKDTLKLKEDLLEKLTL